MMGEGNKIENSKRLKFDKVNCTVDDFDVSNCVVHQFPSVHAVFIVVVFVVIMLPRKMGLDEMGYIYHPWET
jgi:hypothetical protein